jgi:hypothetical protein
MISEPTRSDCGATCASAAGFGRTSFNGSTIKKNSENSIVSRAFRDLIMPRYLIAITEKSKLDNAVTAVETAGAKVLTKWEFIGGMLAEATEEIAKVIEGLPEIAAIDEEQEMELMFIKELPKPENVRDEI